MSECDDCNEGVCDGCDFLDPEPIVKPSMEFIVRMFEVLSEVDEYFDRCEFCDLPEGLEERVKNVLRGVVEKNESHY